MTGLLPFLLPVSAVDSSPALPGQLAPHVSLESFGPYKAWSVVKWLLKMSMPQSPSSVGMLVYMAWGTWQMWVVKDLEMRRWSCIMQVSPMQSQGPIGARPQGSESEDMWRQKQNDLKMFTADIEDGGRGHECGQPLAGGQDKGKSLPWGLYKGLQPFQILVH